MTRTYATLLCLLLTAAAPAEPIAGRALASDGDTISIADKHIRIYGIDSPESHQTCTRAAVPYPCGEYATAAMRVLVDGKDVRCEPKAMDKYHRTVAVCYAAGIDIGAAMVRSGWAVAFRRYSLAYVGLEDDARREGLGMWSGSFTMPWDWRAEHRAQGLAR